MHDRNLMQTVVCDLKDVELALVIAKMETGKRIEYLTSRVEQMVRAVTKDVFLDLCRGETLGIGFNVNELDEHLSTMLGLLFLACEEGYPHEDRWFRKGSLALSFHSRIPREIRDCGLVRHFREQVKCMPLEKTHLVLLSNLVKGWISCLDKGGKVKTKGQEFDAYLGSLLLKDHLYNSVLLEAFRTNDKWCTPEQLVGVAMTFGAILESEPRLDSYTSGRIEKLLRVLSIGWVRSAPIESVRQLLVSIKP